MKKSRSAGSEMNWLIRKSLVLWKIYLVFGTVRFHSARTLNHSLEAHSLHHKWSACLEMTWPNREIPMNWAFQYNQNRKSQGHNILGAQMMWLKNSSSICCGSRTPPLLQTPIHIFQREIFDQRLNKIHFESYLRYSLVRTD